MACSESNTHSQIPRLPAISTVGSKGVSLSARKSCPRPGSGVYKRGARDSVYNPRICLSPLPLSSLALVFWERKREIEDSGRWKLGWNFSFNTKHKSHFFQTWSFWIVFSTRLLRKRTVESSERRTPVGFCMYGRAAGGAGGQSASGSC